MNTSFKQHERVVHPQHGMGSIGGVEEIDGQAGRFLVVEFARTTLTLRIPEAKLARSGLRRLSSARKLRDALAVLPDTPVGPAGHWSRYAVECGQKLNSGEPEQLAELLRDLSGRARSGWGAKLYREALVRLAEELATVEGIDIDEAQALIEKQLPVEPPKSRKS